MLLNTARLQLQSSTRGGDNRSMAKGSQQDAATSAAQATACGPFLPGAMVVVTLGNPRDKFWGMILALAPEGLSLTGVELASFEDFVVMVKEGESFSPAVVFFPMHRIERIELDLPGRQPALPFATLFGEDRPRSRRAAGLSRCQRLRSALTGSTRSAVNPTEEPA